MKANYFLKNNKIFGIKKLFNNINNLYFFQRKFYESEFLYANKNSKVFLEISIDGKTEGKMVIELFSKYVPRTCLNFINFCTGFKAKNGQNYSYKNSKIHKIIPGLLIQGGSVSTNNDVSYYGGNFPDENYTLSHDNVGLVSMVNDGPNTNGSQFFITTSDDCTW